ncbi:GNAT family N-acetyltransferase [Arhodomonas sp. AD133]|uniref:GNAT family N-acetyltransferase n=1 Tax=Arhodomonas sp. AD133 TaxID=3415009 RepID=UPI003EBEBF57
MARGSRTKVSRSHLSAERMERAAMEALHGAASESLTHSLGLKQAVVDGAFVSIAAGDPSILLNRTLGLGLETPATPDTIAAIRRLYADAGAGRFFLHLHEAAQPPEIVDWLAQTGMKPHRRWVKFIRDTDTSWNARTDLHIAEATAETAAAFGRIAASGFDLTPTGGELLAQLVGRPGWHIFLGFAGDEPVGTGALFVDGEVGWCDWAATRPEYRGHGSQSALLATRIDQARALGCRTLYATTGEAVPGDPQHSYHNLPRAGFRELYCRDNYIPAD